MDEFRSTHEHLFDQMKSVFDSYVNPSDKSDVQPLIAGLDRPELDADEFLQQVEHANSDYEVTPSRQTHTDYLEEIGDRTHTRLRQPADPQPQEPHPIETSTEEAVEEIQSPSTEPTVHEEVASTEPTMDVGSIPAGSTDHAAEESTESQPQEPAPVQTLVEEAVEDIQTPSTEPTGYEIPPIYTVKDPDVKDIAGPSSPGLHMQVYAPNVLQQPSEVVGNRG
ncbi:hypothetical protein R1sor_006623 [Riccia sorocarpa]|uniref:Uncharacterized protein n=1 Tax=Riccia sorocarpa TaxID=122646 RepID=A0ABD3HN45_9MARC